MAADGVHRGQHALFAASGEQFRANPALAHEVFGSSSILVKCATIDEVIDTIARMEGQLTATLQMDDGDQADAAKLLPTMSRKVGSVRANGRQTGVLGRGH